MCNIFFSKDLYVKTSTHEILSVPAKKIHTYKTEASRFFSLSQILGLKKAPAEKNLPENESIITFEFMPSYHTIQFSTQPKNFKG